MNYRVLQSTTGEISRRGDGVNALPVCVRVSVHEAGHLVIAAALGAEPADVWIDPTGWGKREEDGEVTRGSATYNGPTHSVFKLLVSLGGPLAEEQLHDQVRQWAGRPGHTDDRRNQAAELQALGGDPDGAIRVRAEATVRDLLTRFASDLDGLAFRLLQRNALNRSDLTWFLPNARAYAARGGNVATVNLLRSVAGPPRSAAASTPAHTFATPSPAFRRRYGLGWS